MTDTACLPHLLKLLDDESPAIRESIVEKLSEFGPNLEEELSNLERPLNSEQKRLLQPLLKDFRRTWLKQEWSSWLDFRDEYEQLEKAHTLICEFQLGRRYPYKLKSLLDQLADEYRSENRKKDVFQLAKFLFEKKELTGTESDYYHPKNSNLVAAILDKRGIPISLAVIYMLVGHRLGLGIEGCNFPGHFLARVTIGKEFFFVDCFNNGQIINDKEIMSIAKSSSIHLRKTLRQKTSAQIIIERVIRNLIRAYQLKNDRQNSQFMLELLYLIKNHRLINSLEDKKENIETKPLFKPGQLVKHNQYGYRGVVVDFDTTCHASQIWYESNQTQPIRDQPWYHVLVDGANHTTYAAQTNLLPDNSGEEIVHPLVSHFFREFRDGEYIRNNEPWWSDMA